MHTISQNPSMKFQICIVVVVFASAIHMFDMMIGKPNNTMVLTFPITEETKPPTNEPVTIPRTYKVAEKYGKSCQEIKVLAPIQCCLIICEIKVSSISFNILTNP